jgi:hypothetical protein
MATTLYPKVMTEKSIDEDAAIIVEVGAFEPYPGGWAFFVTFSFVSAWIVE